MSASTPTNRFRLGTRASALAKTQSGHVLESLREIGVDCEMVLVESTGDRDRRTPLYQMEPETPGLFTKQLEVALLNEEIDLAVHSLKDLPTQQPPELVVAAIPKRAETGDCLLIRADRFKGGELFGLPPGARVGTSSLRREAQMLSQRPDTIIESLRGNVPTRVAAARDGKVDAVIVARAGLTRLDQSLDGVLKVDLPEDIFIPAPGQGALAIETRREMADPLREAMRRLNHEITAQETRVERAILRGLHGGCTLPLGVRCAYEGGRFHVRAFLGLERERGGQLRDSVREWLSFHHFDISDAKESEVIGKSVAHFQLVMKGSK